MHNNGVLFDSLCSRQTPGVSDTEIDLMTYKQNNKLIGDREDGIASFWGREPDLVLHQTDEEIPHIDTYRFPIVETEECPLFDLVVYMTGGMSDLSMPHMDDFEDDAKYAEITSYAYEPMMTQSGKTDFIGWMCGWMAHYPFNQNTYFLPGQTFDWGKPIVPNSDMHGFYFAHPPFIDQNKLKTATRTAKALIHLVPISKNEIEFKNNNGTDALLELFGEKKVNPVFDLSRKCIINR